MACVCHASCPLLKGPRSLLRSTGDCCAASLLRRLGVVVIGHFLLQSLLVTPRLGRRIGSGRPGWARRSAISRNARRISGELLVLSRSGSAVSTFKIWSPSAV